VKIFLRISSRSPNRAERRDRPLNQSPFSVGEITRVTLIITGSMLRRIDLRGRDAAQPIMPL
jgi:hypothetical protein